MIETGTYYPNLSGARTLADAKPLYAGTDRVSIVIDEDEVTLFFGGRIVATRKTEEFGSHAELAAWANELVVEETVDGFAVETVTVMELRYEDQIVLDGHAGPVFVVVTTPPFQLESYSGRTGETRKTGRAGLSISGTREVVSLDRTYRRAKNPKAVAAARWARSRAVAQDLRSIARSFA